VKTLGKKQGRSDIEVEEGTSQRRKEMDECKTAALATRSRYGVFRMGS
jgi:hypothetical protein